MDSRKLTFLLSFVFITIFPSAVFCAIISHILVVLLIMYISHRDQQIEHEKNKIKGGGKKKKKPDKRKIK